MIAKLHTDIPSWRHFLKHAPTETFAKGSTVFLKRVTPDHIYIIKSGLIKVYDITGAGDEQPISFDSKNEIFPVSWALDYISETQYFYQAFTKVVLYKVTKDEYNHFLKSNPEATLWLYKNTAKRIASLQQRVHALQQPKAADKILYTLLYMSKRFGVKVNAVTSELKIPITQQDLALFMGLARETTSVELNKLQKDQIVTYSRSSFYINTKMLEQVIEDQ